MSNQTLERNLLAVSSFDLDLSAALNRVEPSGKLTVKKSRSGLPVPVIEENRHEYWFHSRFDPRKEAERLYSNGGAEGFLVALGLGAAYHLDPFLENQNVSLVLIVERELSVVRRILEVFDLRRVLADRRVRILIDPEPGDVQKHLLEYYLPAVTGNMHTVELRGRVERHPDFFQHVKREIQSVIGELADDYTVQAYFGKKWFSHAVANLAAAQDSTSVIRPARRALVTAAGPSLEDHLDEIRRESESSATILIATDTSLPALVQSGILPDLVITIDCQDISYHHFLQGYPESVPLVIDLASPPSLTRFTDQLVFFSSGHPLSRYLSRHWRPFPHIDTSGGNVSQAALSLSDFLGTDSVRLYGADFSYPDGKSYARGTYLYPFFMSRSTRLSSFENHFFSFFLRNSDIIKHPTGKTYRYTTKPMISYKSRLERFSRGINSEIIPVPGRGEPLDIGPAQKTASNRRRRMLSSGPRRGHWKDFISQYRNDIESLTRPSWPLAEYFSGLSPKERDIWKTLFPAAATIRREHGENGIDSIELLMELQEWSLSVLEPYRG
ncbi:MAG: DUF115 domain-containing protein [Spirochaetales bacterium]|nr:DUF115 domain-containing protein [Spirochaetales bacterium]MCF7938214.1 DUF115 domain-containing protein [Spirochaetales bacterium]